MSRAGPLATSLKDNGVPVYSNFFSNQIANWPTILKYVVILITTPFAIWYYTIRQRAQVIHFYLPEAYIVGGFSSLFLPYLKRIMSRRSLNNYQKNRPFLIYLELLLHKTIHLFTANSTVVAQQLQKEHILPKKIKLIYNGIENLDLGNNPPKAFQINSPLVMLCVANLIPYKGHTDVLQALSKLKNELPINWKFVCVGEDRGMLGQLIELSKNEGIHDNIIWKTSDSDVEKYIKAADFSILCSHEEGFSNFLLETMYLGVPAIATAVGGNTEAIIHEKNGLLVTPKH